MHHQINLLGVSRGATINIFEVKPVKAFKVEKKKSIQRSSKIHGNL